VSGLLLAVGASGAWGVSDFLAGVRSRSLAVALVLLLSQLSGLAVLAGALAVWRPQAWAVSGLAGSSLLPAALAGAAGVAALGLVYVAMSRGGIALVAPVSAIAATLSTAVGLLSGERLTTQAALGVLLALAGTVAAASPPRPSASGAKGARTYDRTAVLAAAGSALCTGAFFILIRMASQGSDPMTATLVNRLSACALVTAWALGRWPQLREVRRARPLALLAIGLVGAADAGAELCYAAASTRAPLSLVAPLSSLYPAVAVVLAVTLLRERPDRIGTIGVVSALAGTALLAGA
jgi:drug/metabolite transporter (DMT)-like permease